MNGVRSSLLGNLCVVLNNLNKLDFIVIYAVKNHYLCKIIV